MKLFFSQLLNAASLLFFCPLFLSACATHQTVSLDREIAFSQTSTTLKKDPERISLYTDKLPPTASYQIVGEAMVSRYNHVGVKRQQAIVHDHLRTLAASMGGDAIINIRKNNKYIMGTVISCSGASCIPQNPNKIL